MKTRTKIWCLVCGLSGVLVGVTIGAFHQDTGISMSLDIGMGLVIGLTIGALLSLISPKRWAAIGKGVSDFIEGIQPIAELLQCCSFIGVLFLSFSATITTFIFGHHLWSSLLAGTAVMGLSIFTLSLAMFLDRRHYRGHFVTPNSPTDGQKHALES